jgi:hypothetical protein
LCAGLICFNISVVWILNRTVGRHLALARVWAGS